MIVLPKTIFAVSALLAGVLAAYLVNHGLRGTGLATGMIATVSFVAGLLYPYKDRRR